MEKQKAKKGQEAAAAKAQREREEKERAAVHRKELSSFIMEGSVNLRPQREVVRPTSANLESHSRRLGVLTLARITHTVRRLPPNSRTKLPSSVLNLQSRGLQVSAGWVASPGRQKTETGVSGTVRLCPQKFRLTTRLLL